MAEYIDRQKAIEAVCGCVPHSCDIGSCGFACSEAYALSKLPAADVRPVRIGKWEHFGSDVFRCSECGYGIQPWNVGVNFCPNCGCAMEES